MSSRGFTALIVTTVTAFTPRVHYWRVVKRHEAAMAREDYYRQKATELLVIARATRDPGAAEWLRGIARGYERLAKRAARGQPNQCWPLTEVA
jgi:hypothetical protein